MKLGVLIPTYDRFGEGQAIREIILAAETLGYDSVWFGDHIIVPSYAIGITDPHWFEALTCAFAGIGLTRRITFGTDVLVLPYRDPILLAKMAATASELSGGRLALGIGVGFLKGEFAALGTPPYERRGAITDEYLRLMRMLFEAGPDAPLSFKGEWVRFENMHFGPRPQVPPPLIVGGNHPRALERAAQLGDGWHPLWPTPEAYADGRRRILAHRNAARIARPFIFSMSCSYTRLLVGDDKGLPSGEYVHGVASEDYAFAPALPAVDGRVRFVGTSRELVQDFRDYAAAGVDQAILRFALPRESGRPVARFLDQMQAFAHEVLPSVRSH